MSIRQRSALSQGWRRSSIPTKQRARWTYLACTFGNCRKGQIPRRKLTGHQKSGGVSDSLKPQQKLIFESLQKAWYNELVYAQFVINEIILERKKFFLFKKVIKIKCPRGEHRGITRQKNVWIIVQFTQ